MRQRQRALIGSMSTPRDRQSPPLYFTDAKGATWRVYDVCYGPPHASPGRFRARRPPWLAANYRAFVGADGSRWLYRFQFGDDRGTEDATLAAQRQRSEYAAKSQPDNSDRTAR